MRFCIGYDLTSGFIRNPGGRFAAAGAIGGKTDETLREKEVINTGNCRRLGCVVDLVVDMKKGCVQAIVVPGPGRLCGLFGYDSEYVIPFECICKVGPDIILVDICEEKFLCECR